MPPPRLPGASLISVVMFFASSDEVFEALDSREPALQLLVLFIARVAAVSRPEPPKEPVVVPVPAVPPPDAPPEPDALTEVDTYELAGPLLVASLSSNSLYRLYIILELVVFEVFDL